jgi:hypothetical protein
MKSISLKFGAGIIGLVVSCTSTPNQGSPDGASDAGDGGGLIQASDGSDLMEVGSEEAEAAAPVLGCFTLTGTGSSKKCEFSGATEGDAGCAEDSGATFGRCPDTSLGGCCVSIPMDGGTAAITATCYYAADVSADESNCQSEDYELGSYYWRDAAP